MILKATLSSVTGISTSCTSCLEAGMGTGAIIGINKPTWRIYDYNFDLYLFEERINMVNFIGGNVGLMYAT